MDVGSIVPGDGDASKQAIEQTRPRVGELVEGQAGAREFGMDGEEPCSGGGLKHEGRQA